MNWQPNYYSVIKLNV